MSRPAEQPRSSVGAWSPPALVTDRLTESRWRPPHGAAVPRTRGSLYQQVLGASFLQLPTPVQRFHALQGRHELTGMVEVFAPRSFLGRILARLLGVPLKAAAGPIRFVLAATPCAETWTRYFPGTTMESRLALANGLLTERLGAAQLAFDLAAGSESLHMQLVRLRFCGMRCPRWLMPVVVAKESATAKRLHFEVSASVPWVGLVAGYRGYLEVPQESAP